MAKGILRVGIIGAGNMGGAIATCLNKHPSKYDVSGTRSKASSAKETEKNLGLPCTTDNAALASVCDVLILAVKPQKAPQVMREIKGSVKDRSLFISIAAGITTEDLAKSLPKNGVEIANTSVTHENCEDLENDSYIRSATMPPIEWPMNRTLE